MKKLIASFLERGYLLLIPMPQYFSIGKIVAAFGTEGEMILRHKLGKKTSLKDLQAVFIEDRKDAFLPYFILSTRAKGADDLYIRLEGIDNREVARRFLQKEIWLEEEDFHKYAGQSSPISLLGFTMLENGEIIGEILEIIEQPHQVLCRVDFQGKDALIPLHDQTLVNIDQEAKEVTVELPDGLLDLYR